MRLASLVTQFAACALLLATLGYAVSALLLTRQLALLSAFCLITVFVCAIPAYRMRARWPVLRWGLALTAAIMAVLGALSLLAVLESPREPGSLHSLLNIF